MKALILFAPGKIAGAEKVVASGYNGLVKYGKNSYDLCIIEEKKCPQFASEFISLIESRNQLTKLNSRAPIDLNLIRELSKIAEGHQIIYTHGFKALFYAMCVKYIFHIFRKPQLGIKIIHTHHGNTGHTIKVKFYEKLALLLMRKCSKVIALSQRMKKDLEKEKISSIEVVNNMNSLDKRKEITAQTDTQIDTQTDTQTATEKTKKKKEILYLGRLSSEKNPETLIKAFRKKQLKDYKLHIVGTGPLETQLKESYESENILFHGHQQDVQSFIERVQFLCLPSLTEGMPMTVIESLCLGTPIMANNVGAIEEMLTQRTSIIIDIPYNSKNEVDFIALEEKWAGALSLLEKEDRVQSYIENARQEREMQLRKYSIERWVTQVESILNNEML